MLKPKGRKGIKPVTVWWGRAINKIFVAPLFSDEFEKQYDILVNRKGKINE